MADREILDVFTCIRNKRELATAGKLLCRNAERFIRGPKQMARLFCDLPEAIGNTIELYNALDFTLENWATSFRVIRCRRAAARLNFCARKPRKGAGDRYGPCNEKAQRQIERELAMIEKLELAGYFLIVWDIVRFCREQGILVQGRGSAANSAVCYALGITAVDPVGMELLFERFFRKSAASGRISIWICPAATSGKGDSVCLQRYGQLGAAMTANVITYRGRIGGARDGQGAGLR